MPTRADASLLTTLKALRTDPARVVDLYRQLHSSTLLALVESGSETTPNSLSFLSYEGADGIRELPLFTRREYNLAGMPPDAVLIEVSGPVIWSRLLEVVDWSTTQVAVDPGQPHGIRLTQVMILGMVKTYARASS